MNLDHIHIGPGDHFRAPITPGKPETGVREFRILGVDYAQGTVELREYADDIGYWTRQETLKDFRQMIRGFFPADWQYQYLPKGKDFKFTEEAIRTQLCGQLNYFQSELYALDIPGKLVLVWANHMPYMYLKRTALKQLQELAAANNDCEVPGVLYHAGICLDLPLLKMLRHTPVPVGNAGGKEL